MLDALQRLAPAVLRHLIAYGLEDIGHVGRILLTGAMIVLPVWLILRLMDARRAR